MWVPNQNAAASETQVDFVQNAEISVGLSSRNALMMSSCFHLGCIRSQFGQGPNDPSCPMMGATN